jgi:hypothetical protein
MTAGASKHVKVLAWSRPVKCRKAVELDPEVRAPDAPPRKKAGVAYRRGGLPDEAASGRSGNRGSSSGAPRVSICSRAALRNSEADPSHSATKAAVRTQVKCPATWAMAATEA